MLRRMPQTCSVEGCGRSIQSNGLCKSHAQRQRRTGSPGPPFPAKLSAICIVEGCPRARTSRAGYCAGHARRVRLYGRPGPLFGMPFTGTLGQRGRPSVASVPAECYMLNCGRPAVSKGLCGRHYSREWRYGSPEVTSRQEMGDTCSVADCTDPTYGKGMCRRHYLVHWRKSRWGVTPQDYDRLLAEQQGRCAICGTDRPSGRFKNWHMDHDHETGQARGLLCMPCNVALGAFKDDPGIVRSALQYLARHGRN